MPSGQAPYNFVELPEKILLVDAPPEQDRFHSERHTGYLDLEILAETPVYTRSARSPQKEEQDSSFYHWGVPGQPVLPGSSLRGAIRNLVEILSYSRLTRRSEPRIESRALVYRGVAERNSKVGDAYKALFLDRNGNYPSLNVKGGYLVKGAGVNQWCIQPAAEYEGRSFTRVTKAAVRDLGLATVQTWTTVFVSKPRRIESRARYTISDVLRKDAGDSGLIEGTLVVPGPMGNQNKLPVIFHPNPAANKIEIPEELWKQFDHDQDLPRGIPNRRITKVGDPLFYLVDGKGQLKFLGPNLFFRLPYENSPLDLLPPESAEDEARLDFAECLFGVAGKTSSLDDKDNRRLFRGRVKFSDAPAQPGKFRLMEEKSPDILSGPKPTSYPYYVEQPPAAFGNRNELESYFSKNSRLRGFKRYWHRGQAELLDPIKNRQEPEDGTLNRKQYTTIRPVDKGSVFRGRVSFENLSKEELGGLLWALELPPSCRHHLGMGKPRGLGSVRIGVTAVTLFDCQKRFQHVEGDFVRPESKKVAELARAAFEELVCDHAGHKGSIWEIPRLWELRCLLEWDNKPPVGNTGYLGVQQFKDPLPRPSEVAGVSTPHRKPLTQAATQTGNHGQPAKPEKKLKVLDARVDQADDRHERLDVTVGPKRYQVQLKKAALKPKEIRELRHRSIKVEMAGERITAVILGERRITIE